MSNNKIGFNYYSVETDRYQDFKIKKLKKDMGCAGIAVYDYILCEIYRVKGYFIVWDESTVFDVAEYFGLKETLVSEIVNYCCCVGLFDAGLLSSERVLTSLSIQSRFIDWSKKAKRCNVKLQEKYRILPEESAKLPEEPPQTSVSLPQSKVKESKEKKPDDSDYERLMKDLTISVCKLPPENIGYKVADAAIKLYSGFCMRFPSNRDLPLMTFKDWIPPVRILVDKKGYSYQQIADVLNWLWNSDNFWIDKILDTKGLEKNFEKIKLQYQNAESTN